MIVAGKKFSKNKLCIGSALILTVVLTSLLAIVGVMFLMTARMDRMATSAVSQQKELNLAVDTIIERISGQLIRDVPGVNIPGWGLPEYHDYPGPLDIWLASLEPNDSRMWQQISDVTGYLQFRSIKDGWSTNDIPIAKIADHSPILLHPADGSLLEQLADADGDGAGDSKWIVLDNMTSGKGIPIYAAIRVVDNGGMLNINTAFKFDPCDPDIAWIDGSSQSQINLMALANRPDILHTPADEMALLLTRANYGVGLDPNNLTLYENNVIWQYGELPLPYTPFDISDELELRNRFLLNQRDIDTRIERLGWTGSFLAANLMVPIGQGGSSSTVDDWFARANISVDVPPAPSRYDYRHIATTCSMDRIITPDGDKMVAPGNSTQRIFEALASGIDPNFLPGIDVYDLAAQLAVNIRDFSDGGVGVRRFDPLPMGIGKVYYGFEPQPFISEIAFKISGDPGAYPPTNSANNSFAVELYNPFDVDIPLGSFRLELRRGSTVVNTVNLAGTIAANGRFIIINDTDASTDFGITGLLDTRLVLAKYTQTAFPPAPPDYAPEKYDIYLIRTVWGRQIYLDRQDTEDAWFDWDVIKDTGQFYSRPDNDWNIVYQDLVAAPETLDSNNTATGTRKNYNIPSFAHGLLTVGDIARVLTVGPSPDPCDMLGVQLATEPNEEFIRINLQNPAFANIFQYLTVIDPAAHNNPSSETRVKGRININTAPPFVIGQLPWVGREVAQAIVAYRDKLQLLPGIVDYSGGRAQGMWDLAVPPPSGMLVREEPGFANIWELLNVTHALNVPPPPAPLPAYVAPYDIRKYGHGRDKDPSGVDIDQAGFPDLTPSDGAANDFEERDVIFSRISNLVTVRSDVFTAYILVRIGPDGPQKRVIAILDRSDVRPIDGYPFTSGEVKVRALHPVPDPW